MASERQLRANRANALKSTGPRTGAGKAIARGNALRHGLTSRVIAFSSEDANAYEELRQKMFDELRPKTEFAAQLVEQLCAILWRLRRASAYEAALLSWIAHQQAQMHDAHGIALGDVFISADGRGLIDQPAGKGGAAVEMEQLQAGRTLEAAIGPRDLLTKLARYETHLVRQLDRLLRSLEGTASGREMPSALAKRSSASGPR